MRRAAASPALLDFARGLGWFSLALGTAEALAPQALSRTLGLRGRGHLVRLFGLREIATGIGASKADDPTPWIKGRTGGDALDIAALLAAFALTRRPRTLAFALLMVLGATAADMLCADALEFGRSEARRPVFDYGDRSGFPRAVEEMRGIARA